jgi:uncharacterized protein (DUF433 family)
LSRSIEIIDRGRGLQLSTSRVTVQDLVPYFQEGWSYEEIARSIPTLSREEIEVVEAYYRTHQAVLDEEDRQIRARQASRRNPAHVEEVLRRGGEKMAALRQEFRQRGPLPGTLLRLPDWAKGVYTLEELQKVIAQNDAEEDCLELRQFIEELEALAREPPPDVFE